MSQEKKNPQRERERLIKKAKHCTETQEECDKCRKIKCDSMMRKRQTETNQQGTKRKKTNRDHITTKRQNKTDEQGAKCKKTKRDCMMRKKQTETEEQAAKCKKTKRDCMRRKRQEMRHQSQNDSRDCNGEDMTNIIDCATKEAKQFFTQDTGSSKPP